ncbi:MAG: glucose-1-phosphate cytidylyltransferase [Lentisphaeria bacterium]|nr:glucose-1-phosphate cytidylyltransferase [Lentisphaeria bacterium]MBQ7395892.1 glucose-1-phosphate cytidylyltransferase [Lentisphaeria bacterium]MBR7119639.1 glucose-1-phosphate cytidylyltransferase [Lentisphaeria bacterium]
MPPVMILCGGKGTRLREVTEVLPKPMVPVGEWPIVWHIMKCYASFGAKRFILCLGYKSDEFINFFRNYMFHTSDVTIKLGSEPTISCHNSSGLCDWEITLARTGIDAMTGCRVFRAAKYLKPEDDKFFLTYGDGLCDVNIDELLAFHNASGKQITITAAHPEARFGQLLLDGDTVSGFAEKPPQSEGYINGGYMVVNREFVSNYLYEDEPLIFEHAPMSSAAADGNMAAFRHDGFWQCMDNPREYDMLNAMWNNKNTPWTKYWK